MAPILLAVLLAQAPAPGVYQLVPAESGNIKQAVEKVVSQMSFLTRGTARSRLLARCIVYPSVTIARTTGTSGDAYRIRLEKGADVTLKPGAPPVAWQSPDGETVQIRLQADFVQIIESKDGRRENSFIPENGRLIIRTKLISPRLPAPVEYQLVYR
jgi:hypothetical protein